MLCWGGFCQLVNHFISGYDLCKKRQLLCATAVFLRLFIIQLVIVDVGNWLNGFVVWRGV